MTRCLAVSSPSPAARAYADIDGNVVFSFNMPDRKNEVLTDGEYDIYIKQNKKEKKKRKTTSRGEEIIMKDTEVNDIKATQPEEIKEEKMNEIIPINGSMPAYLYYFVQAFIEQGVKDGIDYEVAKKLACEAVIGSAKMILETNKPIDQLIKDVCSPGGATLEENFVSTGSGSFTAYGVLEDRFRPNMTKDDAVRLAVHALRAAMRRDAASGEGYNVAVITKDKFEYIDEDTIAGYLQPAHA